ncbi:hypothetical protein EDB85DRAFT_538964 [Lactarius pseudohatsudake]|nr:hypothetical protein EDB85DRAFT_538964 [Lactarius pseudohatsudake]
MFVPGPVISLAIKPVGTEIPNFSRALNRFQKEDPAFRVHIDHESEVHVFHRSRGRVYGRCGGSVERYVGYSSQLRGATQGKGGFSMEVAFLASWQTERCSDHGPQSQNRIPVLPNVQVELQDAYRKSLTHNKSRCGGRIARHFPLPRLTFPLVGPG